MEQIALILGIGVTSFLLFYLGFNLDQEHFFLKFLAVSLGIVILFLMPKTYIDYPVNCELVVENQTINEYQITASYKVDNITNSYTYYCGDTKNTAISFLKIINWFFYIFCLYIFLYMGYYAIMKAKEYIKRK